MDKIFLHSSVFILIFVRCIAMLFTLPLFSMRSASRIAKIALAGYMSFIIFNTVDFNVYNSYINDDGVFSLYFILLAIGEALIGIILGFYITVIFAAFSTSGQLTAFQMGFSAASSYDSLSQIENPLMGQFFNFIAMFVFLQTDFLQILFSRGLVASYKSLNAISLVVHGNDFVFFLMKSLTKLFADAFVISLPIMGTLLMITLCMGLLSKAAPQMNLLSEGFPIMILVGFVVILMSLPALINFFSKSFYQGFLMLEKLFISFSGGIR